MLRHMVALDVLSLCLPMAVAAEIGSDATTIAELAADEVFREHVQKAVDTINSTLARFGTIKRIAILSDTFSVESGELTPTMKMKRKVVNQKYAGEIDSLYAEDGATT